MITFYDLATKGQIKTWSPNPWKTRYVLNLKKLPYKTVYLEFPNIERASKEARIPSLVNKQDGTPVYTCPAIIDDSTGIALPDSFKIAEYLDKQYPDTLKAFPAGSEALQAAFYDQFNQVMYTLAPLIVAEVPRILSSDSAEYYYRTREEFFGKPFDQIAPREVREKSWPAYKEHFDLLDGWYRKSGGPYFMGEIPSFADFTVAGMLQCVKVLYGEESEEWKAISMWNDGRWVKLLKDLEKYADVED